MTAIDTAPAGSAADENARRRAQIRRSLTRRNRAETRFRLLGLGSALAAMVWLTWSIFLRQAVR